MKLLVLFFKGVVILLMALIFLAIYTVLWMLAYPDPLT